MRRLAFLPLIALMACGGSAASPTADDPTGETTAVSPEPAPADDTEPPATDVVEAEPATTEPETAASDTVETISLPVETEPPTTDAAATLGAELVGRWAHYDVVAYEDGTLKTLIISYGFNDFTEVDGQIIDAASFCFSEQRTDQPIQTTLSDAATQAIQPPKTPVAVDTVDGALRIQRAATPTPVGIVLDDPFNESLPTDPNDPRIVDADNDGNPGITVSIEVSPELTGELYIARREVFAYDATLVAPDRLEGVVTDNSEQLVIGASDPIFAQSGDGWTQFTDPARNPVILQRVEPDWDCARLAAERDALFPLTPVVDW